METPDRGALDDSIQFFHFEWMKEVADKLDCYFTIEVFHNNQRPNEELWHRNRKSYHVPPAASIASIDALMQILKKSVPGVRFRRDQRHPEVIRVIDDELINLKQYALDRKVTIKLHGTPHDLSEKLATMNIGILEPWSNQMITATDTAWGIHGAFDDEATEIVVDAATKELEGNCN